MDAAISKENGARSRSFRNEDYSNRRVFLRSYPLHWGGSVEDGENKEGEAAPVMPTSEEKTFMKKIVIAVFRWKGEKALIFRRIKHKVTVYFITCLPVGFKAPTAMISA
ncbi:hypothetical protein CQW23_19420 [Capsicum baccatum]|uniref:Uncharacterized protein n=2 Tax=Capsicum TaxID=4071 RepID=A0A2G2YXK4_CAPAN|nr:hypothetical protein FXO38_04572 [Capsicum annuum]PHT40566.1 hypothetical protein CQW23_19420 [Capsicum baccatum]PHT74500.1 hypothetical protein T459_21777 [Capsicum annuum]